MRWTFLLYLLVSFTAFAQNTFPPIGLWREHAPYQNCIDVTASESKIYAATPYSLFSVNPSTKEIERISKVSGLSETGISTIKYDPISQKLYVAYTNSNIDVLDAKGIHNIPGLKRESITGDKSIYHIYPNGSLSYLSTGLGVLVIDADKFDIRESWNIGQNGVYVKTNALTISNNFFYAATEEGLKRTTTSGNSQANFNNWQNLSGSNGLAPAACKSIMNLQGKLVALQNDSLFVLNGTAWSLFFANNFPIVSINASEGLLIVCQRNQAGDSKVTVLNSDGSVNRTIAQPQVISFPKNGIKTGNQFWIADLYGGLSNWSGNSFEVYKPDSPTDIALGQMTVYNNVLYATAGTVNASWNYQYNRSGIMRLKNGQWSYINQYRFPQLDTLMDFITVAVDPQDESVWAGSYGGGLLHITEGEKFQIHKFNTTLEPAIGDASSYRVSGLAFDGDDNLWVSNFGAAKGLHVRKKDGTWKAFTIPLFLAGGAITQILVDDIGQKWMVSPLNNGLIVFNDNNTIDNTADDKWKLLKAGTGLGGLPSNEVLCIARDRSGAIWVGTNDGVAVIQCPQDIFSGSCEAMLPVVSEGGFTNYLFKGQEVRSIAVDGADRKWIATNDGVWLVSRDGDKVLQQFTETNSPLLSNDVKNMAIDGKTGEVFFATAKGISSYRSGATNAEESQAEVLVFPNPVPPSYNGQIGIRGLPENSLVKITELNGRLIYQTRSLGGQAVWNGRDYKGQKPSSGVYLVIAINDNKTEKAVAKIIFISN